MSMFLQRNDKPILTRTQMPTRTQKIHILFLGNPIRTIPLKGLQINNKPGLYPRKAIISLYFLLSVHFCWDILHCGLDWRYRGDRQRLWCAQTFLLQMPMLNEYTICSAAGTQMETDREIDRKSQRWRDGSHERYRPAQEKVEEKVRERTK